MMRFVVLLLLSLTSIAVNAELSYDLLDKLTDSPHTLQGDFRQEKTLGEIDAVIVSEGQFDYQRDEHIRWVTEKPIADELVMTPDLIISRQDGENALTIEADTNPTVKVMSTIFFAVMTADWYSLSDYFFANGQQSGQDWTVTLTPRNDVLKNSISSVELAGDKLLREITLLERNGDQTHIVLSNLNQ
ncbi:outer membrane lipoprotein carrier protein LolA [uncultured Methylophaga sp.]|uniref:outer membrane lipoprotein carrier protein LolA n=1 Tax=uncultured Methylophaga sp. TaxID=285271 RepID=UPI002639ED2E|nr:outer membrane lipoprotein carrier protein LolA [uncultured Methylophaga sp.]